MTKYALTIQNLQVVSFSLILINSARKTHHLTSHTNLGSCGIRAAFVLSSYFLRTLRFSRINPLDLVFIIIVFALLISVLKSSYQREVLSEHVMELTVGPTSSYF